MSSMFQTQGQGRRRIRVLIVDDSAVVRKFFTQELSKFDDIEVIGSAVDPYAARDRILRQKPDVITLDIEMPRMDGLSFLAKLMKHLPLPVVIVSSMAPENSPTALRALQLGAVEVVSKPGTQFSTPDVMKLVRAVRAASRANVTRLPDTAQAAEVAPAPDLSHLETTHKILAIGASTGGTTAIESVMRRLPANTPGTVIVQHMPAGFTRSFSERLNQICPMRIKEARNGDAVVPGLALIAPGNHHMLLERSGARFQVRLKGGPPVHHQRPAVDILFYSVAKCAGRNALGVILTGMGADGAKGMLAMRESGSVTLAQDEASCIVFGMPKEAIEKGAVERIVSLDQMPQAILHSLERMAPAGQHT